MIFSAYIFPASRAANARLVLGPHDVSEPCKIYSGPYAGMMFLDAALAERDPRWIPLFQPLIADPANEVQIGDIDLDDLVPPSDL